MEVPWDIYLVPLFSVGGDATEIYVPVPLDASGQPVKRRIKVGAGPGDGCETDWDGYTVEFTVGAGGSKVDEGKLLDAKTPFIVVETDGLGTVEVDIKAYNEKQFRGKGIFHFIKLCAVDEDDEVVWLAADAGSYLLNEVYDGESSIDLVEGMAFKFYYDGPNMDETRSIDITGGDGTEHTLDFSAGSNTTDYRIILYEDSTEDLAGGCESWYEGQQAELVHNPGKPPRIRRIAYNLDVGEEGCSFRFGFEMWVQITGGSIYFKGIRAGRPARLRAGRKRSFDWDVHIVDDKPGAWITAAAPWIYGRAKFRMGWKQNHVLAEQRLCAYQVAEWLKFTYTVKGEGPQDMYASAGGPDGPYPHQAERAPLKKWRLADAWPDYKDEHGRWTSEFPAQDFVKLGRSRWRKNRLGGILEMKDRPEFTCYNGDPPKLLRMGYSGKFTAYLVVTAPVGGQDSPKGLAIVDSILKFQWSFEGLALGRGIFGEWGVPTGASVTTTVSQVIYEYPGNEDAVSEDDLFHVYTYDGDGWVANDTTRGRPTGTEAVYEAENEVRGDAK